MKKSPVVGDFKEVSWQREQFRGVETFSYAQNRAWRGTISSGLLVPALIFFVFAPDLLEMDMFVAELDDKLIAGL